MDDDSRLAALDGALDTLEAHIAATEAATLGFARTLQDVQGAAAKATRDLGALERGFASGLRQAFDGLALDGRTVGQVMGGLGRSVARTVYGAAVNPVAGHLGGLMAGAVNGAVSGMMPFAQGGSFAQGRVMPFAQGGIVTGPTAFPMRGGIGLMGEAGPEAIMPLARGPDGRLGVRGGGTQAVQVAVNISTPDAASFQRSQSQIAAVLSRAVAQGARNR